MSSISDKALLSRSCLKVKNSLSDVLFFQLDCEELPVGDFAKQVQKSVIKGFVEVSLHQVSPYTNGYVWAHDQLAHVERSHV
jgi:hypothetical protein